MGIGKRIKEARDAKGMTQAQLAQQIGVTPSSITNYENETSHPKEKILYDLMKALSVDANFLFQDAIKIKQEVWSEEEKALITHYRLLSDAQKQMFLNLLDSLLPKTPFGYDEVLHAFVDVDGARAFLKENNAFPHSFSGNELCDDDICELASTVYQNLKQEEM